MRRTAEQRCRDLAREHGWSNPLDEGDCISCDCPDGKISEDVHGVVAGYDGDPRGLGTRSQSYAYISDRIVDGVEDCDTPNCCDTFEGRKQTAWEKAFPNAKGTPLESRETAREFAKKEKEDKERIIPLTELSEFF